MGHEAVHVAELVAVGVGQADVHHLRPALDLGPADFGRLLELVRDDQVLELPRADDIGPLAHEQRSIVVGRIERLDAADCGGARGGGAPRRVAFGDTRQRRDMGRCGPAATAYRVDPAFLDEAPHLERETLGRLLVVPALVGQPRVGVGGDEAGRHLAERAQVVRHEFRTRGAVEAYREEAEVLE